MGVGELITTVRLTLAVIGWEKIQDGGLKRQKLILCSFSRNLGSAKSMQLSDWR